MSNGRSSYSNKVIGPNVDTTRGQQVPLPVDKIFPKFERLHQEFENRGGMVIHKPEKAAQVYENAVALKRFAIAMGFACIPFLFAMGMTWVGNTGRDNLAKMSDVRVAAAQATLTTRFANVTAIAIQREIALTPGSGATPTLTPWNPNTIPFNAQQFTDAFKNRKGSPVPTVQTIK